MFLYFSDSSYLYLSFPPPLSLFAFSNTCATHSKFLAKTMVTCGDSRPSSPLVLCHLPAASALLAPSCEQDPRYFLHMEQWLTFLLRPDLELLTSWTCLQEIKNSRQPSSFIRTQNNDKPPHWAISGLRSNARVTTLQTIYRLNITLTLIQL